LAERGEDTERLERFAGAMVLSALFTLAAGLSLDLAVCGERFFGSLSLGLVLAASCFAALIAGWFGVPALLRARRAGGTRRNAPA
jgi:hypothetical protein